MSDSGYNSPVEEENKQEEIKQRRRSSYNKNKNKTYFTKEKITTILQGRFFKNLSFRELSSKHSCSYRAIKSVIDKYGDTYINANDITPILPDENEMRNYWNDILAH